MTLIVFHFAVPFVLLLSRTVKREPELFIKVAIGILVLRLVDLFWLIAPEFHQHGLVVSWLDIVLPLSLGAFWLAASSGSFGDDPFFRCTIRSSTRRWAPSSNAARRRGRHIRNARWPRCTCRTPTARTPSQPRWITKRATSTSARSSGSRLGLTVTTMIVGLAVWVLFQYFDARESRTVFTEYPLATQESRVPPEPRLQTNPREDLGNIRAREDQALNSYGWVDKNAGVVRIPIDRAMQLVVERGPPARPANERR